MGQPMDTIKVKMQTFGHLYSGVAMCVKETWRNEGLRRGNIGTFLDLILNVVLQVRFLRWDHTCPGGLRQ